MAQEAKLNFDCTLNRDGFDFTWSGFNDTMPSYIHEVLARVLAMENCDLKDTFEVMKEKLILDLKNHYIQNSYLVAFAEIQNVLINTAVQKKQLLPYLEEFTYENFMQYLDASWLKSGRAVWYISGNLGHEEAIALVESAREKLNLQKVQIGVK